MAGGQLDTSAFVGEERTLLLPAIQDLMLCRRLKCSWTELQDMPAELIELWEAVIQGEEVSERQRAAARAV